MKIKFAYIVWCVYLSGMKAELTKGDVYVVVDTPKKAKKLKNLLDMFKETMFTIPNNEWSSHNGIEYGWGYGFSNELWQGFNTKSLVHNGKEFKKVSIKELRTILAKEHLMEGDYVVCDGNNIVKIKSISEDRINVDKELFLDTMNVYTEGFEYICNFKRYATPEEIALLEPKKKELVVGKWYKYSYNCNNKHYGYLLFNFNGSFGEDSQIGFTHTSTGQVFVDDISIYNERISEYTDANPQEVESALIEEAKRRGFDYDDFVFEDLTNILWANYDSDIAGKEEKALFNNGKCGTIIKQDKFAELKEAHKNGAVIQYKNWTTKYFLDCPDNLPKWDERTEYRIKPQDPVKVGDWMFNPNTKKITQVKKDNHGKSLIGSGWVKIKDTELVEKLNSL